jgi:hypothetical protein
MIGSISLVRLAFLTYMSINSLFLPIVRKYARAVCFTPYNISSLMSWLSRISIEKTKKEKFYV